MVCVYANSVYSSTISFGAFGTNNMFKLYPALPYCFLLGALLGLFWVLSEKAAPHARRLVQERMNEEQFSSFDKYVWKPAASTFSCLNPAIALSGAMNWAGNTNLIYATLGIYLAWLFQFYLKRRYTAGGANTPISSSLVSALESPSLALSSHLFSVLGPVKTRPSSGGGTTLPRVVWMISYITTMLLSRRYRRWVTLVLHQTSILLTGEVRPFPTFCR